MGEPALPGLEPASSAVLSSCRRYRYVLTRGLRSLAVVNLFAWRATDPKELAIRRRSGEDVIGPENDRHLFGAVVSRQTERIVVAWGGLRAPWRTRSRFVGSRLLGLGREYTDRMVCLGRCIDGPRRGDPRHPLMLSYGTEAVPWA